MESSCVMGVRRDYYRTRKILSYVGPPREMTEEERDQKRREFRRHFYNKLVELGRNLGLDESVLDKYRKKCSRK